MARWRPREERISNRKWLVNKHSVARSPFVLRINS